MLALIFFSLMARQIQTIMGVPHESWHSISCDTVKGYLDHCTVKHDKECHVYVSSLSAVGLCHEQCVLLVLQYSVVGKVEHIARLFFDQE